MKKKIFPLNELVKKIKLLKKKKQKISLCHGVYDLLHPGHIHHFNEARKNSNILIVSITSDQFVNKGPGKPFFNQKLRMSSIAALQSVDFVVLSNEKSAIKIIKKIRPDFYIKGNDYKNFKDDLTGKIVFEKKEVLKYGGQVIFTTGQTFSSSKIINSEFFYNQDQNNFLKNLKKNYSSKEILQSIERLQLNKPLVVGDTIIDEYIFCKAIGKSGKEPYMVMQEKKSEEYLGGVLSIAQNLSAFSEKVFLLSSLGSIKSFKKKILSNLRKNIIFDYISRKNLPSIIKKRFIEEVDNTKMLGVYSITEKSYDKDEEKLLIKKFFKFYKKSNLVIISDYGHGFFNKNIRNKILSSKKFIAINVQLNSFSRGYHTISKYQKADLILMNETELRHELRDKDSSRLNLIKKLQKIIRCKYITITHGKTGASLYDTKNKKLTHVPAFARNVIDKVGAGDALFPILASCLNSKIPTDISLYIASISAAINSENYANKQIIEKTYLKKYIEHSIK